MRHHSVIESLPKVTYQIGIKIPLPVFCLETFDLVSYSWPTSCLVSLVIRDQLSSVVSYICGLSVIPYESLNCMQELTLTTFVSHSLMNGNFTYIYWSKSLLWRAPNWNSVMVHIWQGFGAGFYSIWLCCTLFAEFLATIFSDVYFFEIRVSFHNFKEAL